MAKLASTLQSELTSELDRFQPRRGRYYHDVSVLMLVWQDDDLGCLAEVKEFSALLETDFNYFVQQYLIPTDRPQISLNRAVSEFLYTRGSHGNLVLIYYAGHGDPDLDGEREAVWAALKDGGPTLRWHYLQPTLESADCDIVIFLDCCFAGQAARGRSPHRIELLAAAAMGLRTPGVGQKYPSFTEVLMREMKRMLNEEHGIRITTLHRNLLKKEHKLQQQPLHVTLNEDGSDGIVLRKLSGLVNESVEGQGKEMSYLTLQISLFELPSNLQKDQILRWLTVSTPPVVSAITVQNVYTMAQSTTMVGEKLFQQRSRDRLDGKPYDLDAVKSALLYHFQKLISTAKKPLPPLGLDEMYVLNTIQELEENCEKLLCAVEDCVPNLTPDFLQNLAAAKETKDAGLADRISMRLKLLDEAPSRHCLIEEPKVHFESNSKESERFRKGTQGGSAVMVEYYYYSPTLAPSSNSSNTSPVSAVIQAKRVAALLAEPKDEKFCTLPGRGTVHEHLHRPRLGFIYEIPQPFISLQHYLLVDCYRKFPAVPLERRFDLAHRIATAVVNLHSIGWLHKNIKSQNVLIFCHDIGSKSTSSKARDQSTGLELEFPYLVGFDCSRHDAAESLMQTSWDHNNNLFRHPDRWGRPLKFKKVHEIYALGILLLEIAFWRPVHALDPEKKGFSKVRDPEELRDILLDVCSKRLAHTVGSKYAKATEDCLVRGLGDDLDSWQFQRYVRGRIVDKLRFNYRNSVD